MSEDEHSDSEFHYPDELHESHKENSEDTALSGYEQVYENGREEIESSVNKQQKWKHDQENFQWHENISALFIFSKQGKWKSFGFTCWWPWPLWQSFSKMFAKLMATSLNLTR